MIPEPNSNSNTQSKAGIHKLTPSAQHRGHATDTDAKTLSNNTTVIHNKLLPELMSHIFELCVDTYEWERQWEDALFEKRRYPKGYFKPLYLGSVCRDWREIAFFTHGLWNKVFILLDTTPSSKYESAHTWLSRSGNHPLTLYVAWKDLIDEPPSTGSHLSLIETINQYSSRWSHLFLSGSCKWMSQICSGIPEDRPTPYLKTLKMKPTSHASDLSSIFPTKTVLPPSFSLFLTLKRESRAKDLNVNWVSVTHLELSRLRATECMDILEEASQLISLSVEDFIEDTGNYIAERSLVHRTLQSFKSCSRDSDFNPYLQFFQKVSFPALSELYCEFIPPHNDIQGPSLEALTSFIERSGSSLKILSLIDISSSDAELIHMLETIPSLEDLQITQPSWLRGENGKPLKSFWEHIEITDNFLPNLRSLSYMSRLPEIPWGLFPKIFGSIDRILAKKTPRPLNTLTIVSSTPPPDPEDEDELSDIKDKPDMDLIDRDIVVRFMQLQKAGMIIDIYNAYDLTQDLLKRSMDIHDRTLTLHSSRNHAYQSVMVAGQSRTDM